MNYELLITTDEVKKNKCLDDFNVLMKMAEHCGLTYRQKKMVIRTLNGKPDDSGLELNFMNYTWIYDLHFYDFLIMYVKFMKEEQHLKMIRSN